MLQNLMLISVTLGGIFLIVMTIVKSRSRTDLIKKLSNPGFLDSEGVLIPEYAPQFVRHSELTEEAPYSQQQVEGMLSRASELHPDHPELSIAWAYFQPERALSTLNRAIEKHPENLELRLARLKAYDDTVDPRKLEAEAREIAELPGGDTEGQFALAEVYVRIGRPENMVGQRLAEKLEAQ